MVLKWLDLIGWYLEGLEWKWLVCNDWIVKEWIKSEYWKGNYGFGKDLIEKNILQRIDFEEWLWKGLTWKWLEGIEMIWLERVGFERFCLGMMGWLGIMKYKNVTLWLCDSVTLWLKNYLCWSYHVIMLFSYKNFLSPPTFPFNTIH